MSVEFFDLQPLLNEGVRLFLLLSIPLIAIPALISTVVGAFQGALTVREDVLLFAARLIGVVVALWLALPSFVEQIKVFTISALS